uniref:Uncharacterized protein n=1 Tax=Amazona collaria TaxID=241587 RepID=A0A8B9FUT3_9PSIT
MGFGGSPIVFWGPSIGDDGVLGLSRISWDSEAKPWHIKGIHFGPPIAQPVDIDSRHHSHCFISDYLWSLIPHEW